MAKRKVDLPADPTALYEPPADANLDDLKDLASAAQAEAERLLANDNATAADVDQANRYIAAIEAIDAQQATLIAAQEEHAQRIAEARSKLKPREDATDKTDPEGGPADPDEEDEETKAKKVGGEEVVQVGDISDPSINPTGEPLLVASARDGRTVLRPVTDQGLTITPGRRSAVAAAAGVGPAPQLPAARDHGASAYLVAAAEVRGMNAGDTIDWGQAGKAAENRFSALPKPRPGVRPNGGRTQLAIASVHMPTHDEALVADGGKGDFAIADEAIDWAVSNQRLKRANGLDEATRTDQASLVAAGGWCAPSETLYDLLDITTDDGMLDVPGITVTRGGVRYSLGPDFTQVYVTGNANFTRTEAQAIAGTPSKPMVNIPCPTFTDNRMVVDGLYLTGDILTSKGYPEAYTDYIQKAMKAFAHYVNAASITDQVNLSTVVDLSVSTGTLPITNRSKSATVELLGAVELQLTDMRYKNRLSMTQGVEVIAPFWLRGNIRSDLAKRMGWTNPFMITDADISSWFANRGASIQYVYDWQDAFTGVAGGFGSSTAIAGWPNTANILMYPAGTFVRALDPVIELNAVYDSTLLSTNQYVALFMEQGRLTLKRHWDARNLKVDVSPLGNTVAGSPIGPVQNLQGSVI